ncbi:GSCFA domain-containing protein [Arenibaculum sp.]|uniref:GSCFA domain-containing protein n=1 Tax=Arenibaculum sp. TaxID=2865862 RepID=UPI002E0F261F|nr:GSCFA domain-containing protein [Arenibaculum sp.]
MDPGHSITPEKHRIHDRLDMNPYQSLPSRSFWRSAVAERDAASIDDLWTPKFPIGRHDAIATAGSCFARHIGRALAGHGMNWLDAEPAPSDVPEPEREKRHYGVFSFRTGNVYTAAMLRQWVEWALGVSSPPDEVWTEGGRFFDPFRPAVEPEGFGCVDDLRHSRRTTLRAVETAMTTARCFVFTLGLTEAWSNDATSTVYPVCPGTIRGTFDPAVHRFRNFTHAEVHDDLNATIAMIRNVNPGMRILLTVSPVPLTATATGRHALTATTYSKSVLRAAAGQLAEECDHVDYFPSYEMITGFPFKGMFFEKNMRSVSPTGVDFVMRQFFGAIHAQEPPAPAPAPVLPPPETAPGEDFLCDDAVLDYYRDR